MENIKYIGKRLKTVYGFGIVEGIDLPESRAWSLIVRILEWANPLEIKDNIDRKEFSKKTIFNYNLETTKKLFEGKQMRFFLKEIEIL